MYPIIASSILPSYLYYGIVVNTLVGDGTALHISELAFYERNININNTNNSIITSATITHHLIK